jgi:hypothetical protein
LKEGISEGIFEMFVLFFLFFICRIWMIWTYLFRKITINGIYVGLFYSFLICNFYFSEKDWELFPLQKWMNAWQTPLEEQEVWESIYFLLEYLFNAILFN